MTTNAEKLTEIKAKWRRMKADEKQLQTELYFSLVNEYFKKEYNIVPDCTTFIEAGSSYLKGNVTFNDHHPIRLRFERKYQDNPTNLIDLGKPSKLDDFVVNIHYQSRRNEWTWVKHFEEAICGAEIKKEVGRWARFRKWLGF